MEVFGFGFTTVVVIIVVIYLLSSIKILAEYERGVIFRLGRLLSSAKGPGIILVFAPIDRMVRVSLRQEALQGSGIDVGRDQLGSCGQERADLGGEQQSSATWSG